MVSSTTDNEKTPRISVQKDDTNGGKRPGKTKQSSTDCDKPLSTSSQIDSTDGDDGETDPESPSTNNEKSLQAQESATKDKKQ